MTMMTMMMVTKMMTMMMVEIIVQLTNHRASAQTHELAIAGLMGFQSALSQATVPLMGNRKGAP